VRPCITCGRLIASGSRCPGHGGRQTPGRGGGRAAQRFRDAVLTRAAYQCEAIINGIRCERREGLEAHHLIPLRKGGANDPITNGVCLCPAHHRIVEREAVGV
jgi:hypothetical protein